MPEYVVETKYGQMAQLGPAKERNDSLPRQDTGAGRSSKQSADDPADSQWVAAL